MLKLEKPILSISMPNYNHGSFLPQRIPSLLEAMPFNSELIIVDDGSTDGSQEIIQEFARRDSRIVFIKKAKNEGVLKALSDILTVAKGEFICFQSSDDYILPEFFHRILNFAQQYPGFAIYTSNFGVSYDRIPLKLEEIESSLLIENLKEPVFFSKDTVSQIFAHSDFWIPGHSSIIKREYVELLKGFQLSLRQHSDWFLIHSIAFLGGVAYLPQTLAVLRLDNNSFSSRESKDRAKQFQTQMNLFRIFKDKNFKKLRAPFRRSAILRSHGKARLFSLIIRPIYWDFLLFFVVYFFRKRIRKIFKTENLK